MLKKYPEYSFFILLAIVLLIGINSCKAKNSGSSAGHGYIEISTENPAWQSELRDGFPPLTISGIYLDLKKSGINNSTGRIRDLMILER